MTTEEKNYLIKQQNKFEHETERNILFGNIVFFLLIVSMLFLTKHNHFGYISIVSGLSQLLIEKNFYKKRAMINFKKVQVAYNAKDTASFQKEMKKFHKKTIAESNDTFLFIQGLTFIASYLI